MLRRVLDSWRSLHRPAHLDGLFARREAFDPVVAVVAGHGAGFVDQLRYRRV
jgi:hypothetical protein